MKCSNCGAEVKPGKFCEECGAPLEASAPQSAPSAPDTSTAPNTDFSNSKIDSPNDVQISQAMQNLKKYEEGTITHPDDKPKKKRKFWCPQNPMLWAFIWLTVFGLVLVALIFLFFAIDIGGSQIVFAIAFGDRKSVV